jgi:hypothetical protein
MLRLSYGGTLVTVAAPQSLATKPAPGRRYDHFFFSVMSLLILLTVFIGFAHTYYLAGLFHAPLPNRIIHIHGAVFSCWILLFFAQTSLVAAHRIDIHRRLGLFGFGLSCLMVVLGLWASTDVLLRRGDSFAARAFYAVPLSDMLVFATFVFFAYRFRTNAPAHKRLILTATIALLDAAFVRWPIGAPWWHLRAAEFCTNALLLGLIAYDLFSLRTVHRMTLWASASLVFIQQVRHPIGASSFWQHFAASVQNVLR